MQSALEEWQPLGWNFSRLGSHMGDKTLIPSIIFSNISFSDGHRGSRYIDADKTAFLRLPSRVAGSRAWAPDDLLQHPIAARSFATFPPVPYVPCTLLADYAWNLSNHDGVTVSDVLSMIHFS